MKLYFQTGVNDIYLQREIYIYNRRGGCFSGKMCSDRQENHGCGQKNQKVLAVLYLASGPLRNAANLSVEPTELAAEPTTKMKTSKANFVT